MTTSFDADRWARLEQLFHEANELPPEDVPAFVERACGEDEALRHELEALLTSGDTALPNVLDHGAALLAEAGPQHMPERVGSYRIERELGRGGMGVVYLGIREAGDFEHRAAIKMLPAATYDAAMRWRFQNERQILASLKHPGIARLLDGGTTEAGVPYVVMDFVDGDAIDVYCEKKNLELDERLMMFLEVCEAVSFAHTKLVAHRDIKPSNILVDSQGEPKLLDFGIAKLVESDVVDADVTATRIMTLTFASPEQVAGEPVGTGADVYALGTLLYLLVTGQRPHGHEGVSRTELARRIVEDDPRPPSVAAGDPRLKGDLDTIVRKALERRVEDRYASVEAMAADIDAHLNSLPISATPPTFSYRASRFLRRHRAAALAAGVAGLALILGAVGLSVGMVRARAAEADAVQEAQVASQVTEFLVGLFDQAGADSTLGRGITAVDLLQSGVTRIDDGVTDPEIQSRLKLAMGRSYMGLGFMADGTTLLEEALSSSPEDQQPVVLTYLGVSHRYADNPTAGREVLTRAIQGLERRVDTTDRTSLARTPVLSATLISAIAELGYIAGTEANFEEAEQLVQRALRLRERQSAEDSRNLANTISGVASTFAHQNRFDEAIPHQERAVAMMERTMLPDDMTLIHGKAILGMLYAQVGQRDTALVLMQESLSQQITRLGEDHPDVAQTLHNLGGVFSRHNDDSARVYMERGLDAYERLYGSESLAVTPALINLGLLAERQDRLQDAVGLYGRAAEIRLQVLGDKNPRTAYALLGKGNSNRQLGRFAEAEEAFRQALDILRPHGLIPPPALRDYAEVLRALGREADAAAAEAEADELSEPDPGG